MLVAADLTWVMTKPARDYVVDDDDDDKQRPGGSATGFGISTQ